MPRRFQLLLIFAIVLLAATGTDQCQSQEKRQALPLRARYTIGVSFNDGRRDFCRRMETAFMKAAASQNIALALRDAQGQPVRQTAQVRELLAASVDALLILPCTATNATAAVQTANKAAIPICTIAVASTKGKTACHVDCDNLQAGRLAGQLSAALLYSKGELLTLASAGSKAERERALGVRQALAKFPAVKGTVFSGPFSVASVKKQLASRPGVRVIVAASAAETKIALQAVSGSKEQIAVVSCDYTGPAAEALKAAVEPNAGATARAALAAAVKLLGNQPIPKRIVVAPQMDTD